MTHENTQRTVAVIGTGNADEKTTEMARRLGRMLAEEGYILVSGGLEGVMRAASRGAAEGGGRTIGIVPGTDPRDANPFIQSVVATGLGPMRNYLVVLNADVVVALEGGWGTLSEIALAKKIGKAVVAVGKWATLEGVLPAAGAEDALQLVKNELKG